MEHGVDYELQAVDASTSRPLPVFWVKTPNSGPTPAPHVCSRNGLAYRLIVHNNTDTRIAVKVRPRRQREMVGFQLARTFSGGKFRDEHADFVFGRPSLVEPGGAAQSAASAAAASEPEDKEIGCISMDVHEAVAMECPHADLKGSTASKPDAVSQDKKSSVFSSLTVPGARQQQTERQVQRWYRDGQLLQAVKLYYKEEHALMFYGVSPTQFGHAPAEPAPKAQHQKIPARPRQDFVETCDLTQTSDEEGDSEGRPGKWSRVERPKPQAEALD